MWGLKALSIISLESICCLIRLVLQLLALVVSLLDHVRLLHLPLVSELLVFTNDGLVFLIDVLLVDGGLCSGSSHLVLDLSDCLLVFIIGLNSPVLLLIKYLLFGLVDDGELNKMLANLRSDFIVLSLHILKELA